MPVTIHVYHESAAWLAARVRRAAPQHTVVYLASREALRAALPAIEFLLAPMPPRDGWSGAQRLRLVQLLGAGVNQVVPSPDLPAAVEVAGVRGVFAPDVAEHALALMLAHSRGLAGLAEDQRARRFEPRPIPTLAGEPLAIVGYGEVGRRLARISLGLDMRVCAISRTGRGAADGVELVASDRLGEAIAGARYVVIAAPLTPATTNLFDTAMIGRLRRDAFLINIGRGGIVDEAALADALDGERLAGAALDVFTEEPLPPTSRLWSTPRLVITPHVAGLGERYLERCIDAFLANVAAYGAGLPRTGLADRELGY